MMKPSSELTSTGQKARREMKSAESSFNTGKSEAPKADMKGGTSFHGMSKNSTASPSMPAQKGTKNASPYADNPFPDEKV